MTLKTVLQTNPSDTLRRLVGASEGTQALEQHGHGPGCLQNWRTHYTTSAVDAESSHMHCGCCLVPYKMGDSRGLS